MRTLAIAALAAAALTVGLPTGPSLADGGKQQARHARPTATTVSAAASSSTQSSVVVKKERGVRIWRPVAPAIAPAYASAGGDDYPPDAEISHGQGAYRSGGYGLVGTGYAPVGIGKFAKSGKVFGAPLGPVGKVHHNVRVTGYGSVHNGRHATNVHGNRGTLTHTINIHAPAFNGGFQPHGGFHPGGPGAFHPGKPSGFFAAKGGHGPRGGAVYGHAGGARAHGGGGRGFGGGVR